MSDGTSKVIYCHWDGYVSYNGVILDKYYNTQEKVEALIALGSLSCLSRSTECPEGHSFDTPVDGYCIAYGRDRGEEGQEASLIGDVWTYPVHEEYLYFWVKEEQRWYVKAHDNTSATLLSELVDA
jgi:hypothetical protein